MTGRSAVLLTMTLGVVAIGANAKLRMAEIAAGVWGEPALAEKLLEQAALLKKKFNQYFWIDSKGYFALGLDKDKNQIDSLASSNGQLLWSGIVADDKIPSIIEHLASENLYNGWGVRTLSKDSGGYNPVAYHRGTVWPHDNSLIAAGIFKSRNKDLALKIIQDIIHASSYFDYRLPEVFAGYDKAVSPFPIEYPTACSPQAWAAGTPILFLRLILGLEPDLPTKSFIVNASLPPKASYIHLDGLAAFGKHFSIKVTRNTCSVREVSEWSCHQCHQKITGRHSHK